MRQFTRLAATLTAAAMLVATAGAAYAQNALTEIQSRGTIVIAVDVGNPPFGATNAEQQPEGADIDTARLLAQDLGVEVEFISVTGPNRVPFLQTGQADLVLASFSMTPERARSVNFSNPYGALKLVIWAPESVELNSIEDLAGKRIGVTRGGIQDTDITRMAPEGTEIVRFDNDATVTAAMLAGQVDAFATADHLARAIANANPEKQLENKVTIRDSYYAVGVRQGEHDLLHWVNTWIQFHKQDGQLADIYQRWMGSDLPELPTW